MRIGDTVMEERGAWSDEDRRRSDGRERGGVMRIWTVKEIMHELMEEQGAQMGQCSTTILRSAPVIINAPLITSSCCLYTTRIKAHCCSHTIGSRPYLYWIDEPLE